MQTDLVSELPPSSGYENVVKAMYVFRRYLIAYPTSIQGATPVTRVIINITTKHAYLPTTIIPDKKSVFVTQMIKELGEVLGRTQQHTTTRHAETIDLFQRKHGSIKKALETETSERRSMWHRYVNTAFQNCSTFHFAKFARELGRVVHRRTPYDVRD